MTSESEKLLIDLIEKLATIESEYRRLREQLRAADPDPGRLVELLGAQRISPEGFRTAFEAVQADRLMIEEPAIRSMLCNLSGVRNQVFEVIVKQALGGAPWREICAGPMQVNNITPDEIEDEVRRLRGEEGPATAKVPRKPIIPDGPGDIALPLPDQEEDANTDAH